MPSWVQFQGNGRSESILEDLRQGTVVNELTLAIDSTCTCLGSSAFSCCYRLKATLFSILCFLHFKGWGGGEKENRNAAFKSLMCHTVPFKPVHPSAAMEAEEWRTTSWNVVLLDQVLFWILDFSSFVPLEICLLKKFTQLEKGWEWKPTEVTLITSKPFP